MSDAGQEDDPPTCDACGAVVAGESVRRVRTWVDDGSVEHRHFCGRDCERRWEG